MPRSTCRRRRDDDRHAIAGCKHRTTRAKRDFDSSAACFFRAARSRCARRASSAHRAQSNGSIALGETRKIPVIPVSGAWYGFDPIHLKRRVRRSAWPTMLAALARADEPLASCAAIAVDERVSGDVARRTSARCLAFGAAQRNRAVACPMERRSRFIECARSAQQVRCRCARVAQCDMRTAVRAAKKFFARSKIFGENVLH